VVKFLGATGGKTVAMKTIDPKKIQVRIPEGEPEPPLYRSRYGGLWIDRRDAHDVLEARRTRGEVTDADVEILSYYIDNGYVVFPKATEESVIDEYLDFFEAAWDAPAGTVHMHWNRNVIPIDREHYDDITKVSDVHSYFERGGELIFPPPVLRFLTQIYDRPPVVFQTMTMRKGSEENQHIDTGPLTLTEPMSLCASWVALEDVQPQSGPFQFIPGSHRLPELLLYGTDKANSGNYEEYGRILNTTLQMCEERGLKIENFMAKKGDVLIWHADLMHGGAPIQDPRRTRKSLVAHFMPLGVMPTFFDCSEVNAVPYPSGGYCTDRLLHDTRPRQLKLEEEAARRGHEQWRGSYKVDNEGARAQSHHKVRPIDLWREWVPLTVRKRISPSVAGWVRKQGRLLRRQ
jgi:phytanoyl-CoA hydroxylase